MVGYVRDVAYRVFGSELSRTEIVLERDPENSYAPQYVVTPTGAKITRVFWVGALTDREDIGQEQSYWKATLVDPTEHISAYAGQYQVEAARALSQVAIPAILAIVGKVSVYVPEDGGTVITIRPESVAVVDKAAQDRWIFQTAIQTLGRIRALEAEHPETVQDMKYYRTMVKEAAKAILE